MTILLVGGGSGGHITPLLAVAHELKKQRPDTKLIYIGERGGQFKDIASQHKDIDQAYEVSAGKFRRYHGESWLRRLLDVRTNVLNIRDGFRLLRGIGQAKRLLRKLKPELVFIKGGFVGVPVGKACAKLGVPYVIHDSDTVPGLANRLIAKQAALIAVGMPKSFYPYPADRMREVGIPVTADYVPVTAALQQQYRVTLDLPQDAKIVLVTGGSLGAQRLNGYVHRIAEQLLLNEPRTILIHQVGQGNLALYKTFPAELQARIITHEYIDTMYLYSGAADVVVTRAGATAIAELAVQGRATLLVPSPFLTGGHQLVNAQRLAEVGAVEMVSETVLEEDPVALLTGITALLEDSKHRQQLSSALQALGHPRAAAELAQLLLQTVPAKTIPIPKKAA